MTRSSRRNIGFRFLVALVVLSSIGVVSSRASAASDELSEAKARITAAQQEADEAAAEFDAAQTRYYGLQDELQRTERETKRARARANELIDIVRERAVVAYKSGGGGDILGGVLSGTADALENAHRSVMLNHANAESQAALNEVRIATDELRNSEGELRRILDTQARELEQMKSRQAEMQERIASANAELAKVKAKLARERRINEYNKLVKEAQAEARAAAVRRQASAPPPATAPAPVSEGEPATVPVTSPPPPSPSGMVCPVAGPVSFSDTYGSPRSGGRGHKGVDMFAAAGTPVVAILPGSVFYQSDYVGGLSVYLQASDGNTYYYTHLMDYVGGARSVSAGEVLGHVGNTGNAFDAPPQLHFERRIGGPNGERVNPYSTVRPIC